MTKIAVLVGSTRPGRLGKQVADWFYDRAQEKAGEVFELVDIADFNLPILDEDEPGKVSKEHTKKWAETIDRYDGYVFVTPEYNHGIPGSFKNAIDFLNKEWAYKPVAYVSYGWAQGHRSVEMWRPIAAQFHQYDLREEVNIQIDGSGVYKETERYNQSADHLIKSIVFWSNEFKSSRQKLA